MDRIKKKKEKKKERRLCVRERELRERESEKGRKLLDQFVGGRKEKKGKKERKLKEKRKMKETEPASCSGRTRRCSEWNCTSRSRCLPTSDLFYA